MRKHQQRTDQRRRRKNTEFSFQISKSNEVCMGKPFWFCTVLTLSKLWIIFVLLQREEPQGELIRFCRCKTMAYIFYFRYEAISYGEMPTHEKHVPFTLLQRIHSRKEPYECKGSVKNCHGDCQFTVHRRFQVGEKTFECEKMGRPVFVPHTLCNTSKFTLMRNLIHVENLEKCARRVGVVVKHRMSFSLSSSQTLALSS